MDHDASELDRMRADAIFKAAATVLMLRLNTLLKEPHQVWTDAPHVRAYALAETLDAELGAAAENDPARLRFWLDIVAEMHQRILVRVVTTNGAKH